MYIKVSILLELNKMYLLLKLLDKSRRLNSIMVPDQMKYPLKFTSRNDTDKY